jgi:hypothetical protein
MPATGFITRIGAALLLSCLLAGLLFSATARAGECGRLCDEAFLLNATSQQIEAEIKSGANPNGRDKYGRTPLHQAVSLGTAETVEALARAGANLEARAVLGLTPPAFGGDVWNSRGSEGPAEGRG